MHLVLLVKFVAKISTSLSILVQRMCLLYLPLTQPGLRHLNSYVNLTGVVQWLRLALWPNRVGVSPLIWDRKQVQFPKCLFFYYPEYRTVDNNEKSSNTKLVIERKFYILETRVIKQNYAQEECKSRWISGLISFPFVSYIRAKRKNQNYNFTCLIWASNAAWCLMKST
jgi:hypothetical protein